MKRKSKKGNYSLDTLIGAQTTFEGAIYSERSVCVEGSVQGRIEAKGEVVVGREGRVEADIQAESVVVGGRIIGNIIARTRLEITATGRVVGDIEAATITIAEGGMVDGLCKMIQTAEAVYPQLEQGLSVEEGDQASLASETDSLEELPQV
jgi:cytoskeletal protein CcmA (bactofilin family)